MSRPTSLFTVVLLLACVYGYEARSHHKRDMSPIASKIIAREYIIHLLNSIDSSMRGLEINELTDDEKKVLDIMVRQIYDLDLEAGDNKFGFPALGQYWTEVTQALSNLWNNVISGGPTPAASTTTATTKAATTTVATTTVATTTVATTTVATTTVATTTVATTTAATTTAATTSVTTTKPVKK